MVVVPVHKDIELGYTDEEFDILFNQLEDLFDNQEYNLILNVLVGYLAYVNNSACSIQGTSYEEVVVKITKDLLRMKKDIKL